MGRMTCLAVLAVGMPMAQAAACVGCQADDATSLLQVLSDVQKHGSRDTQHDNAEAKRPLPHGWFGAFSEEESTYTDTGRDASPNDPEWDVLYGRNPGSTYPLKMSDELKPNWFHEGISGGDSQDFQGNYPSLVEGISGNQEGDDHWRSTPSGWTEEYKSARDQDVGGPPRSEWFDDYPHNMDGFSRMMRPTRDDGEFYVSGYEWKERSVNASLTCPGIGCEAYAAVQLFDHEKEEGKLCRVSIGVYPTDYDDDWGREHVEFLSANNYTLTKQCTPLARGCNKTAAAPLYPCVNTFDVDHIVVNGTLNISGKNSELVDECPHEGNLLSGVVFATCNVRNKSLPEEPPDVCPVVYAEGVLKCNTPGCNATVPISIDSLVAASDGVCCLNVSVAETDYDDSLGKVEQVDYIAIANLSTPNLDQKWNAYPDLQADSTISVGISPGRNPCSLEYENKGNKFKRSFFNVVENEDVTKWVNVSAPRGVLDVRGRISPNVDECAFKGNLLYALVTVTCAPKCKGSRPVCKGKPKTNETMMWEIVHNFTMKPPAALFNISKSTFRSEESAAGARRVE